jgi:hypothetical protein
MNRPFEIVVAALLDLVGVHVDVVDEELVVSNQAIQIEAQRSNVLGEVLRRLLKRDEDPRLSLLHRSADEELHREKRLPAPRAATNQGWPARRKASPGDLIQPGIPVRAFGSASPG